jgi:hypothetical protein
MRRNGREAPIPGPPVLAPEAGGSTLSGPSWTHDEGPELVDFAKIVEDVFGAFALNTTIRNCAATRRSSFWPTVTRAPQPGTIL